MGGVPTLSNDLPIVDVKSVLGGFVNEYYFGEGRYHWFIEHFLLCHRGHVAVVDEA